MIEYIALGTASATTAYYAYCSYSFYKDLKKTIVKKLAETNDRIKTLEDIFRPDGIHMQRWLQPKSGIPPNGDIGTIFLKPTIHLAKTRLLKGHYDDTPAAKK
jgi:hypothetical protein